MTYCQKPVLSAFSDFHLFATCITRITARIGVATIALFRRNLGLGCRVASLCPRLIHLVARSLAHFLDVGGTFVGVGVSGEQLGQSALLRGLATQLNQHVEGVIHGEWVNSILDAELECSFIGLGLLTT